MAEPMSSTAIGLATLAAMASVSDLVQGADAYISLADPAEGCALDVEPFHLKKPPKEGAPPSADKNKALRPEGAKPASRADTPKGQPAPPSPPRRLILEWLLTVENKISVIDVALGNFKEPTAVLALDVWDVGPAVLCIPRLSRLVGFATRIQNQVSFTCRATADGDSSATIVTQALYNPFAATPGRITAIARITMADRISFQVLDVSVIPADAFTIRTGYWGPVVRPKT